MKQFGINMGRRSINHIHRNTILREWVFYNMLHDDQEDGNKFEILLTTINPKLAEHLRKPQVSDIVKKSEVRVRKRAKDEKVMKALKKYKEFVGRFEQEDKFSLDPNEEI